MAPSHLTRHSHHTLQGMHRLCNVVASLDNDCPWTRTMSASEMLIWLRGEIDELAKEIDEMKDALETGSEEEVSDLKRAIVSETGDVLFDALMVEMMVRREFGLGKNDAWDAASEKVERRTPYMKEWGDGTIKADTPEDAEHIWQAVKKEEKRQMKEQGRVSSNAVVENIRARLLEKKMCEKRESGFNDIRITEATSEQSDTLWRMLTFAASMGADGDHIAEAKEDKFLRKYVEGWGSKSSDVGFIAQDSKGRHLGAAWARLYDASDEDSTLASHPGEEEGHPELAIGVLPEMRGQGVGTLLIERLIESVSPHHHAVVLSVREENPDAIRFYQKLGFIETGRHSNRVGGQSLAMQIDLKRRKPNKKVHTQASWP